MRSPRWLQRLSPRLGLSMALMSAVPLVVLAALIYGQWSASIRAEATTRLEAMRAFKVKELNAWLDEREGDLRSVAGDFEIRDLEHVVNDGLGPADRQRILYGARELLRRYVRYYHAWRGLDIVEARSFKVLVSTEAHREGRVADRSAFLRRVARSAAPKFSPVFADPRLHQPTLVVGAAVRCRKHHGQHVVAVVVAHVDLTHTLYPAIQQRDGMGHTGEALLVNRDRVAINALRFDPNAALTRRISAQPAARAAHGHTGVIETKDYRGVPVLAAYTHLPRMGWGLVVKQDQAELYAPLDRLLWQLAGLLLISLLVVLGLSWMLARTISRPVQQVAAVSRTIASGALDTRADVKGPEEVAELSRSLNEMAESLSELIRIREATARVTLAATEAADVPQFCERVIEALLAECEGVLGVAYLRAEPDALERAFSTGVTPGPVDRLRLDEREGQVGAACAHAEVCYLCELEPERFTVKTVAGEVLPAELAVLPLWPNGAPEAALVVGATRPFSDAERRIFAQCRSALQTVLGNLMSSARAQEASVTLQATNDELTEANQALRSQSSEVERQARELQRSAEELELRRQQVEEADRLKSEFLANMSHELRTPLNSILALSQLMLSRAPGHCTDQETEYLEIIERNGRHLLQLINEILDLSRIEAGHMELQVAETVVAEVVAEVVATSRPLAEAKELALRTRPGKVPLIRTDRQRVRQILLNLVGNAVKFTDQGEVTVEALTEGAHLVVAVRDTGPGIPAEALDEIFDEFRQLDGSTARSHGGTGLGLAISRRLARLLGGDIEVSSQEGQGSEFRLLLPLQARLPSSNRIAVVPRPTPRPTPRAPAAEGAPRRLLVVEDTDVAAQQVCAVLADSGYDVARAKNGAEALQAVRAHPPDGILLDLMMPGMDGFSVLEQLRASADHAHIPVLVITAKELTAADHARLAFNNVQQLVQKGAVDLTELLAQVERLVQPASPEPGKKRATAVDSAPRTGDDLQVLVVEDHPDNQRALSALLQERGVTYAVAESGPEALEQVRRLRPRLVLLDIQLPGMSGLEVTRRLRQDPALPVTLVAVSAHAMPGDREAFLQAGGDDYLSKPIDPVELDRVLSTYLEDR